MYILPFVYKTYISHIYTHRARSNKGKATEERESTQRDDISRIHIAIETSAQTNSLCCACVSVSTALYIRAISSLCRRTFCSGAVVAASVTRIQICQISNGWYASILQCLSEINYLLLNCTRISYLMYVFVSIIASSCRNSRYCPVCLDYLSRQIMHSPVLF